MLTSSHQEPRIDSGVTRPAEIHVLAEAFTEFISASASLEASYETLKQEVAQLSYELAERNKALSVSLAENEQVHLALKQIVSALPCGVLVVESDGVVVMMNPEAQKLLGLGEVVPHLGMISKAVGLDLSGFVHGEGSADGEQEFCRLLEGKKQWISVQKRCLESKVRRTASRSGRETIVILRDVTLHKTAEAEREQARKAIALSEVAGTLAHEIRNPLTSLELFAGLIAKGGPEAPSFVSHLHAGIRSLARTVNNVLAIHGNGYPVLHALDLLRVTQSSVEFARPIADQAGVVLQFVCDADALQIRGNSSAIQQLLLNLVFNAVRHSAEGGEILVSAQRSGLTSGSAIITVKDEGTGIAPEHLARVFEVGFSANGSTSGLGLAVCRRIAEQHGGTISVGSQLGVGTTFSVEIPTL